MVEQTSGKKERQVCWRLSRYEENYSPTPPPPGNFVVPLVGGGGGGGGGGGDITLCVNNLEIRDF